jgi:hypothetical protein
MRKSSAVLWVAFSGFAAFAQKPTMPPTAEPPASIEGEVRSSVTGMPIERAHVVVISGPQRYGTFADAEGKFHITGLPAGHYLFLLDRVGFISSPSRIEADLHPGDKAGNFKLKLTPTGTIIGRVLDAEGQPMEGVAVTTEIGGSINHSTSTDDRGVFRIGGLRPGKVRVRAQPTSFPFPPEIRTDGTVEVHYSPTYYPSDLDAKTAMRVEVGPGAEVTGIDIRMIRTPLIRVSGKVIGIPQGATGTYISMHPRGGSQVKPDGSFEMWRVDPGKYTLAVQVNRNGMPGRFASAPTPVEVGQSDIENIQVQVLPIGDLKGQVIFEDEEARKSPATGQRHVFLRAGLYQSSPNGELGDDGSFTLKQVEPGVYHASISAGPAYVKSVTLGPSSFDGDRLDLTTGIPDALLVLHLVSSTGAITGVVRDDQGPVPHVRVGIMEESWERGVTQSAETKEDGSYSFPHIAPGRYRVFLYEDSEDLMLNTEQLDEIADEVEVHDHETATKDLKRK